MVSPPKPWERAGLVDSSTPPALVPMSAPSASSSTAAVASSTSGDSSTPAVPARPPPMTTNPGSLAQQPYNPLTSYNPSPYTSPFSTYNSTYNSPYNRFGTTYSPYGAGYGGGLYGGMGYGMGMNGMGYGMNGMYGGMGMPGMPMDPNQISLTQTLESTTQQTFALLHSIVQTFTGLSQMLESTFMATHSSFFAMVGVIDQFSHLRNALGGILGLFGLVRWMKDLVTGKKSTSAMRNDFREFINGKPVGGPNGPKPSKKPLIIFLLAIFGVPYAMHKLIRALTARAAANQSLQAPFDPSQLTFARAKYHFNPASPVELSLKENEIVAIMGKLDPATGLEVEPFADVKTDWWKGRTREGREGWFPSKWVEVLERKKPDTPPAVESKPEVKAA